MNLPTTQCFIRSFAPASDRTFSQSFITTRPTAGATVDRCTLRIDFLLQSIEVYALHATGKYSLPVFAFRMPLVGSAQCSMPSRIQIQASRDSTHCRRGILSDPGTVDVQKTAALLRFKGAKPFIGSLPRPALNTDEGVQFKVGYGTILLVEDDGTGISLN